MPGPYHYLKIAGDPTAWLLSQPIDATALTQSGQPFRATILMPRNGTLLLSGRAAASVVLSAGPGGGVGPNGGGVMQTPFVYLPSVTGLTSNSPGSMYALPAATNLNALEAGITDAMSNSQDCTVELADGAVVLNGTTLPFVVFFEAAATS